MLPEKPNFVRSHLQSVWSEFGDPKSKYYLSIPFYALVIRPPAKFFNSPIRFTWLGASRFATNREELKKAAITRQEYQEHGSTWVGRKFSGAL